VRQFVAEVPRGPEHFANAVMRLALASFVLLVSLPAAAQEGPTVHGYAGGDVAIEDILEALRNQHADNFRPVGTTSFVFQMQLTGPIDAAWRPESQTQRRGWLNEIAAYRIAERLGMDTVPPSVVRFVDRGQLRRRFDPEFEADADVTIESLVVTGNNVRGSATYWVPGLIRTGDLDSAPGFLRWSSWLQPNGEIPVGSLALARDLSAMAAFDVLIGNADRGSGSNMRTVETNGLTRLAIRDHNLAFASRISDVSWGRMLTMLRRVRRFSPALVERIEALDEAALRDATNDPDVGPLLDDNQIAGVLDRREAVLGWIGALSEMDGEDAILSL
jgi:hypothetical protein